MAANHYQQKIGRIDMAKIEWGDFDALMREIVMARGYELKTLMAEGILSFLKEIGWESAKTIVIDLTRRESMPSNILGTLKVMWGERKTVLKDYHEWEDRKTAVDEEYVASGELSSFQRALAEAVPYHGRMVVSYSPNGELAFATIAKWEAAGQPKHWGSPSDYICANPRYMNAYDRSVRLRDDSLKRYYDDYYDALVAYREKRDVSKAVAA
jgi:hypothetical protein